MVSPVGLSTVTKMAPARVVGMTMGAWFLYTGLSNYLAGIIARTTGAETISGQVTNIAEAKTTYGSILSQRRIRGDGNGTSHAADLADHQELDG